MDLIRVSCSRSSRSSSSSTSLRRKVATASLWCVTTATAALEVAAWCALSASTTATATTALELASGDVRSRARSDATLLHKDLLAAAESQVHADCCVVSIGRLEVDKRAVLNQMSVIINLELRLHNIPSVEQCQSRRARRTSPVRPSAHRS